MAKNGVVLTPSQQRSIAALLTSRSAREAASVANVPERTLTRWLTDDTFQAALSAAEGTLIDAATRRLLQHQDVALTVILTIMADKEIAPSTRLRAAIAIIDFMLKLRELRNVEQRLTALEAAHEHNR